MNYATHVTAGRDNEMVRKTRWHTLPHQLLKRLHGKCTLSKNTVYIHITWTKRHPIIRAKNEWIYTLHIYVLGLLRTLLFSIDEYNFIRSSFLNKQKWKRPKSIIFQNSEHIRNIYYKLCFPDIKETTVPYLFYSKSYFFSATSNSFTGGQTFYLKHPFFAISDSITYD